MFFFTDESMFFCIFFFLLLRVCFFYVFITTEVIWHPIFLWTFDPLLARKKGFLFAFVGSFLLFSCRLSVFWVDTEDKNYFVISWVKTCTYWGEKNDHLFLDDGFWWTLNSIQIFGTSWCESYITDRS